jgi:hypothetical protein
MKAILSLSALAVAAAASLAWAATSADQFQEEMKKCTVCKIMVEEPGLMESMTWECHKIGAGMLCVASVPKDKKETYDAVHKKMMEAVAQVTADKAAGKTVDLCGFCKSMGELEQAGAKSETIDTKTGSIYLVTSTDPAILAKIHAQADHAIAEQEAMERDQQ